MGLLFAETTGGNFRAKSEAKLLQQLGCKACSLNHTPGKIDATGSPEPVIYILGEAAGRQEEEQRKQFVGKAGSLLRDLLPRKALPLIRWNNTLNCHPPSNREPTPTEIECCRPRVATDIERSKPDVIWGFGNVPLSWTGATGGITNWRGRRMPVRIGNHVCWYYAFFHPSFLSRNARGTDSDYGSEEERMTAFDLRWAFEDLENLPKPVVHTPEMARANVELVTDVTGVMKALQWASRLKHVGFDYETNCLRPYEDGAKILTAAVGNLERAFAFPVMHPGSGFSPKQVQEVLDLLKRFLLTAPCAKTVHNLAFEMEWSAYFFGPEVLRARPWEDTANAAAIVDERRGKKGQKGGPFSLEFLVRQRFGFSVKSVSAVDRENLENTPLPKVLSYNGIDAKYHDGIWVELQKELGDFELEYPYELARRRVPTVVLSQLKGAPVDQECASKLSKKYGNKVEKANEVISELKVVHDFKRKRGRPLKPQSNPDLLYLFDELLRCKEVHVVDKFTKESKRSVDETVLTQIIDARPQSDAALLAQALIDLREASGTKSKYVDSLLLGTEDCAVYPDGLIHTNFNTYFAETGRISSDDPNLQNFPKRDEGTKEVRRSIRAPKGCVVLAFDYGQIEARVIAMFTKDKAFCKALWERYDVHQEWAERVAYAYPARIGGKKYLKDKKVLKTFRTDIKNQWTFPLFFGAKDSSVAGYLNIPVEVIRPLTREFWKQFAGVHSWQEEQLGFYHENGYVECLTGRRRRGPLSVNQIYNSPVQGTAAEIVLDAMCRLSETEDPDLQPEINIHDDFTYLRVPEKRADLIAEKVIGMMLAVPFKWVNVPITVEMSMGPNWCDLEEIGTYSSDTWEAAA